MRHSLQGLTLAGIAALLLCACGGRGDGGGSGSSSSSGGATNVTPTANAGPAQTVTSGTTVTLTGTASSDSDGTVAVYAWTQTAGAAAALSSSSAAQPTFTAPTVGTASTLTFSLIVTDNRGAISVPSTVNITVNPPVASNVNVTGRVRYARPPFNTSFPFGLNYANPQFVAARAVVVRARNATTQTVLATGRTNDTGDFTLSVAGNTSIVIEVVAQLLRETPEALPAWNVTVRNGVATTPYVHADTAFNSSAGTARNIDIPLGIGANGQASGTRSSGPFAILDSIYQGIQLVTGAAPTTTFPALVVDWGSQTAGTFFDNGSPQYIALMGDLSEDTDEFDRHVIAHEFGHYIEHNFSRADNIGGAHGGGDRLDPRVAFGEGFGYAFAGMVFNDPNARDSFHGDVTNDGVDNPQPASGVFNVELNPTANLPANPGDSTACWCSESSVWSILWDLFDANSDTNDTLQIGFQPIWSVLTGVQRTTPAFTTIFSFASALKTARPADVTAINTLLGAQNIVAATIEPFASTETNAPTTNLPNGAVPLPIYSNITRGGSAVVLQTAGAGNFLNYNKVGNRRWLRLTHDGSTPLTITITSSANDPDFEIYRNGGFVLQADSAVPGTETVTINPAPAGTYLIDAYDCANGCTETNQQGSTGQGIITLTVSVN